MVRRQDAHAFLVRIVDGEEHRDRTPISSRVYQRIERMTNANEKGRWTEGYNRRKDTRAIDRSDLPAESRSSRFRRRWNERAAQTQMRELLNEKRLRRLLLTSE